MTESYSPNLFLFQNYIQEVVKEGKKHIKTAPFDSVDPEGTPTPMQPSSTERSRSSSISTRLTSSRR
jgi:hypothetical protein